MLGCLFESDGNFAERANQSFNDVANLNHPAKFKIRFLGGLIHLGEAHAVDVPEFAPENIGRPL